jgi:hypothetical protein
MGTAGVAWIILAVAVWAFALILIPRDRFLKLLPFGIYAGFLLALVIHLMGVPVLGLWAFRKMTMAVFGIPVFLLVAYIAEVMLFVNFLPTGTLAVTAYILAFSLANLAVEYLFSRGGYRIFIRWGFMYTFLVAILSHLVVYSLYLLTPLERDLPRRRAAMRRAGGSAGEP